MRSTAQQGLLARERVPPLEMVERPFARQMGNTRLGDVAAAGGELLAERPRTRAELAKLLGPRWPDADPSALAHAVTFNLPLVQTPPCGLWGESGQARWALTEDWLGASLDPEARVEDFVLRYLAAFGPATTADFRTWSGLTGLGDLMKRLRPRLRVLRDEKGRELVDVPRTGCSQTRARPPLRVSCRSSTTSCCRTPTGLAYSALGDRRIRADRRSARCSSTASTVRIGSSQARR